MENERQDIPGLIAYFLRTYPRRSALIVALSVLAGFSEGIGIASLLPLIEVAAGSGGEARSESSLMSLVRGLLDRVGLEPTLEVLLGMVVVGMILKGGFLFLSSQQVGNTVAAVGTDLRLMLIRALLRARWGYFVSQRAGHVANAIGIEASRASSAYSAVCGLLAVLVQALIYLLAAVLISPLVAIGGLVAGGLLARLFARLVRVSREAGRRQTRLKKSLSARLVDAMNGLKPIKAMAQEDQLQPLLERETYELNETQREQVLASGTMKASHEPLLVLFLAAGLYATLSFTEVRLAGLLVMVFLFQRLVGRIHQLQLSYQSLVVAESSFWSMHEAVREAEMQHEENPNSIAPPPLEHGIRLEGVRFGYTDRDVLRDVSLEIPAGQFVAIVGPSGAGKTTIVDLVIGLYQPGEGTIHIDGVPLSEIDRVAWRKMIGYVPQEMLLFHDSIYRNVTLGDESIDREAVAVALQEAGAAHFVAQLPEGIDTVIGERGARLSGGQRQRIAIARALVRKPKLLVLDEVTTALDPKTEAEICATLRELPGEVTILSISHQPAMTRVADVVYRLENGHIIQQDPAARVAQVAGA